MSERSKFASVVIARAPAEVYEYVVDPAHLPEWAAGVASGIERRDGRWVAKSPMGEIELRFAPRNEFGVLDHDVVMPDGTVYYNPMRVVPHEGGSEVVFGVRRPTGASDVAWEADVAAVQHDLETLARVLEP
ncbi:SRPBCC family protein [Rhodococcus sp. HNM0569]|uniref:SRPBCC family protein n=1 Tax=Rhodococcus sp. HNM0569 TaxID=2716340 RepID=UPI00146AD5D4|nr:SRPBCC family protein [Rhodococcus sp. HNM0569]NLU85008.1 SRPBCC family protein [Rhodococcus sp. HNM0569]